MKTTTRAQDAFFFGKSVAECEVSLVTELMLRSKGLILSHLADFGGGEWVCKQVYGHSFGPVMTDSSDGRDRLKSEAITLQLVSFFQLLAQNSPKRVHK